MNYIDPHLTKHTRALPRQQALCEEHLDMITWSDLFQIIPEANNNTNSDSYRQMEVLVAQLRENPDASALKMLKLLRRLGLALAEAR